MSTQDIIDFVESDTRSMVEIFESIKQGIQEDYGYRLSEEEAIAATRRFIGYFQVLNDMMKANTEMNLDRLSDKR